MCSFPIREARIGRVVFAITSPMMGGFSKWNVLRDDQISNVMPEAFGSIPETVAGLLSRDAENVWRTWNPIVWGVIKHRGCFGPTHGSCDEQPAVSLQIGFIRNALINYHNRHHDNLWQSKIENAIRHLLAFRRSSRSTTSTRAISKPSEGVGVLSTATSPLSSTNGDVA